MRVGICCTQTARLVNGGPETGALLCEIAEPWMVLSRAGYTLHLITPDGGEVPIDPVSRTAQFMTADTQAFRALNPDEDHLKFSIPVEHALKGHWDCVLGAGGHGIIEDGDEFTELYRSVYEHGGVIGAVCHGPWGLVNTGLLNGVHVTCFSDQEEEQDDHIRDFVPVPWLEEALLRAGAKVHHMNKPWTPEFMRSACGRIITGRNPQSGVVWAREVCKQLELMRNAQD